MNVMCEEQRKKLHQIIQQLKNAQSEVEEAYETTMMSDAKWAVSRLCDNLKKDESIDPSIKSQILPYFEAAHSAILGLESTYKRAGMCGDKLNEAESCIIKILSKL
jgi:exonuclease VII small subunit